MKGTELATIYRAGPVDKYGDPTGAEVVIQVPDCIVWPRTSTEDSDRGRVIIDGQNVAMPPGTDVRASDEVAIRGVRYEVEGVPGDFRKPRTGRQKQVIVVLKTLGSGNG